MIQSTIHPGMMRLVHGHDVKIVLRVEFETRTAGCWVCRDVTTNRAFILTSEMLEQLPGGQSDVAAS